MPKHKISFAFPKGKHIALFDQSGINILEKYVYRKDICVIDPSTVNVFAFLRMLLAGKKSLFDYTIAYLKMFNPNFVFTFIDNHVDFYKLSKLFPEIKFIAIQNGLRANYSNQIGNGFFDVLKEASQDSELSAHAICVFGKASGDQFAKFIRTTPIITGSLKNNMVGELSSTAEGFDIVFISQHSPFQIQNSTTRFFFGNQSLSAAEFHTIEQRVVHFLAKRAIRIGIGS